ncbi:hypothetical protein BS78_08G080100 [Paspalum vaginatum]|nr:hypothetical protein BS78_08G080100 [Paspalum vaginatum]
MGSWALIRSISSLAALRALVFQLKQGTGEMWRTFFSQNLNSVHHLEAVYYQKAHAYVCDSLCRQSSSRWPEQLAGQYVPKQCTGG